MHPLPSGGQCGGASGQSLPGVAGGSLPGADGGLAAGAAGVPGGSSLTEAACGTEAGLRLSCAICSRDTTQTQAEGDGCLGLFARVFKLRDMRSQPMRSLAEVLATCP